MASIHRSADVKCGPLASFVAYTHPYADFGRCLHTSVCRCCQWKAHKLRLKSIGYGIYASFGHNLLWLISGNIIKKLASTNDMKRKQLMCTSSRIHRPTTIGIGKVTLVVACCIVRYMCTSLKRHRAWSGWTDRGMCISISILWDWPSLIDLILQTIAKNCHIRDARIGRIY